jgi:superfamily II DNA/RNA helicase
LVNHHDRAKHTADLVDMAGRSIVFTRTRHGADRLAKQLSAAGIRAVALHGGRNQNQRNKALREFSDGGADALVATDVAARGIHIDAVASVIHFDPPADSKDYLHRSGRTARAGATGTIVSLVTRDQQRAVRRMQQALDLRGPIEAPRIDAIHVGARPWTEPTSPARRRRTPAPQPPADSPRRQARPARDVPSVYVANLPWGTTDADVATLFGRFGQVHQTTIITDRRTGRSKGYGFVDMPEPAAKTAIRELDGSRLGDRDLTVRFAQPRRSRD